MLPTNSSYEYRCNWCRIARYSSGFSSLLWMMSGLTMQHSLFICLALDIQVGSKIQKLAHNSGKIRAPVEVFGLIDDAVVTYNLMLQYDIVRVEDHQIDPAESSTSQVGQDVDAGQFTGARSWINRQAEVISGMQSAGDC